MFKTFTKLLDGYEFQDDLGPGRSPESHKSRAVLAGGFDPGWPSPYPGALMYFGSPTFNFVRIATH